MQLGPQWPTDACLYVLLCSVTTSTGQVKSDFSEGSLARSHAVVHRRPSSYTVVYYSMSSYTIVHPRTQSYIVAQHRSTS